MVSSKQVIAPPPPPPPEFFRPNEFDIGAFGTYATGVGSSDAGKLHAWCQTQSYLRIGQRYLRMTQNPL